MIHFFFSAIKSNLQSWGQAIESWEWKIKEGHQSLCHSWEDGEWSSRVTRLAEFSPDVRLFTLGSFFNCKSSPHFFATFRLGTDHMLIFKKTGLGYTLGDFFTDSSGHPDGHPSGMRRRAQCYNKDAPKRARAIHRKMFRRVNKGVWDLRCL
jgi:hypothetical protein